MKTIEQLNAEHEAARATLTRQHEIAGMVPVIPDHVMLTKGAAWVCHKAADLTSALAIFDAYADKVISMAKRRGTFLTLAPDCDNKQYANETHQGDYCAALSVDQGEGFGPSAKMFFFVRIADLVLRVNIDFGPSYASHSLGAQFREERGYRNKLLSRKACANTKLNAYSDSMVSFATGDSSPVKKGANMVYLFVSDNNECTVFDHFRDCIRTIAHEAKA